jgi:hypothetical protein
MTNPTQLERSYRRLLAVFPKAFRREHEQEMLAVLMAGAAQGQRRPRFGEVFDLLRTAIFMRLRRMQLPSSWEPGTADGGERCFCRWRHCTSISCTA